jgi:iron complex outermembrane receptor protein
MVKFNKLAFCGASLIALATPAYAQQAEPGVNDAADIIVSARRRDERLQDVPSVVNAIPAETIAKLNIQDSKELQSLVPGLQLRSEANGIGASGQLRGIQYDINSSASPSVAFYLNDAPIGANVMLGQMFDIGQVEVLRGPQGTLRGASVPSGSITYTTRKASLSEVGASASASYSDAHHVNVNAALGVPLIKDMLAVRVAGVYDKNRGNLVTSNAPISTATFANPQIAQPYAKTYAGRVSAVFQPTDWLKVEGMYQHQDYKSGGFDQYASFSLVQPSATPSPTLITPGDLRSIWESPRVAHSVFNTYNWRGEVRFAGQKLVYQGSHNSFVNDSKVNQDVANFRSNFDFYQTNRTVSKDNSHEIRLQNEDRVADLFDYIVGYYHTDAATDIDLIQETPVALPGFLGGGIQAVAQTPITRNRDGKNSENAIFGNVTAYIGDKLQISAGARHIKAHSPRTLLVIGANSVLFDAGGDDKAWIYTGSVQYKVNQDLMVYASTGTSFRGGPSIFNSAIVKSPRQLSFLNLGNEKSTSYEVGFKSSWLDNRLIFNFSLYHQKFDNFPYKISNGVYFLDYAFVNNGLVPSVGNSAQFGAAVPVTVKGIEAELSWRASDRFNFGVVASYSDGQIKNGVIPCNDLNGDNVADTATTAPSVAQLQAAYGANNIGSCNVSQRSAQQSPFSATAQAEYKHPVSDRLEFFARGLFTYYGASKVDPTLSFDDLDSYGLFNLFGGLRASDGSWEVNLFARNLFNTVKATRFTVPQATSFQELQPPTFRTTAGTSFTSTYSQVTTNLPREFGINLRFAFGSR